MQGKMNILPININNKKQVAFKGGLTSQLEKRIFAMPCEQAKRLLECYDKKYLIVGYFPKDILKKIQKNFTSSIEVDKSIKIFNQALAQQSQKIIGFEKEIIEKVKNIDILDFAYKAIIQNTLNPEQKYFYPIKYDINFEIPPVKMELYLNNPKFTSTMRDIGIIPKDGRVFFDYVGQGAYKNCFRMDFLDENNQKIISSKALMIGKIPNLGEDCNAILKNKIAEYIKNTDYETFFNLIAKKIKQDNKTTYEEKALALSKIYDFWTKNFKDLFLYDGYCVSEKFNDINGIFPESNIFLTIRKMLGKNMKKSNIVEPYIFDLKNNYGLREFADETSSTNEIFYDFRKNGYVWLDEKKANYSFETNKFNKSKIIDPGGVVPLRKIYHFDN